MMPYDYYMTKTQTPTTPATPILEWEPEALNHLSHLKAKVDEAKAMTQNALQTARRMDKDQDVHPDSMDWAMRVWEGAVREQSRAEAKLSDMYFYYRPN